jgi:hypothetical protein
MAAAGGIVWAGCVDVYDKETKTAIQTVGEGKQPMGGALGVRMEIVGAACAISG